MMAIDLEQLDDLVKHATDEQFAARITAAWPTISAALWAAKAAYVECEDGFDAALAAILTPLVDHRTGYTQAMAAVHSLEDRLAQYHDPDDPWMADRTWGGRPQDRTRRQAFEQSGSIRRWKHALAEYREAARICAHALADLGHPITDDLPA
jgi:hypothetical protein